MHHAECEARGVLLSAGCVGAGGSATPPQLWMSSPRWRLYQARKACASRALKNTPPIPVTRCIARSCRRCRARKDVSAAAIDHHGARHLVMPGLLASIERDPDEAEEQRRDRHEEADVA